MSERDEPTSPTEGDAGAGGGGPRPGDAHGGGGAESRTGDAEEVRGGRGVEEGRTLEVEVTVDAPPDEVWEALTTAEGLRRWFPLDARVEPGQGGNVWVSWGPGSEGSAPIHIWDPPRRFGWTEFHGGDESGTPIQVAADFHLEARSGVTVVRVVQSGFGASADWEEMYDAVQDGWRYFLFNLAFYFREHRGKDRAMVWRRFATDLPRDTVWERLVGGALVDRGSRHPGAVRPGDPLSIHLDEALSGTVVSARPNHHLAAMLPDLAQSLLFVEIEGPHVGVWLSTYGLEAARVRALQSALDDRLERAFGEH